MMFICFLATGSLITWLELKCTNSFKRKKALLKWSLNIFYVNLFSLFLLRYFFQKRQLLLLETYDLDYSIKYLLFSFAVGIMFSLLKFRLQHSSYLKYCQQASSKQELKKLFYYSTAFLTGWFLLVHLQWANDLPQISFAKENSSTLLIDFLDSPFLMYLTGTVLYLNILWSPVHVINKKHRLSSTQRQKIAGIFSLAIFIFSLITIFNTPNVWFYTKNLFLLLKI